MSSLDPQDILTGVLAEIQRAQKLVSKHKGRQITNADDRDLLKSVAYAWFRSHRPGLDTSAAAPDLTAVDECFQLILQATDRASAKSTYVSVLKDATGAVRSLRAAFLTPAVPMATSDKAPDFAPLAADPTMRLILVG